MTATFSSPLILSILSDFRAEAIVPEGQYSVIPGVDAFKIVVHDYTNLYFRPVNSHGHLGVIFIFPDYYRHSQMGDDDFDPDDPELRQNDHTASLCP